MVKWQDKEICEECKKKVSECKSLIFHEHKAYCQKCYNKLMKKLK